MATGGTGSDILMVAAIDFGTTYSGYAYSLKGEYEKDKLNIHANQAWNSGGKSLMSLKTPTCILINKENKEFESFGYEAENAYADIVIEDEADNYYFFDRFKMMLYTREDISTNMEIEDIRGNSLPAIDVFAAAIGALRQHMMDHVKKQRVNLQPHEIKWVLTVPAMWTDKAKEFMRESAEKAGIRRDRLMIALEPEAASIYCQHLPPDKMTGAIEGFSVADDDTKYLVVDIGGGTVDITAHHKVCQDNLQELCSASGGACGGTTVDKEFLNFLENIVGERVMESLANDNTASYLDLLREFEILKRSISVPTKKKINFTIKPFADLNGLCLRFLEKEFKDVVDDSEYRDKISLVGDKLRMDGDLMTSLFDTACSHIVQEIRKVLQKIPTTNLKTFLLVGGFSECLIVQDAIQQAFPDVRIMIPREDPGLAVVKGAVLFGHKPDFITSRITRCTYGRRIRPLFDESKHDPSKRVYGETRDRCRDVFETFMQKNKRVAVDEIVTVEYHTVMSSQGSVSVAIYYTFKDKASYVDDNGCKKLGEFRVPIPSPSQERRHVDVQFKFGWTELEVIATERQTGERTRYNFSLIN
ncbi:heat shock 70 kDa protein 12A-like isoform X1 [Mytilus californianus]|uniref:heat shock 70 kDa protein 12A-like isoform X1 n=1 Tax=Mytilus californianus TaxID=6549 RepID=UPI0022477CB4|nr:heat shock 70 kDa protein 12A-like isoform X1 [Mytilus californianus]